MKEKFRLTEQDYRYLFENSSDAMWVHDIDGAFLYVNKAFERISGRSLEEWSSSKVTDFIDEKTLALSREVKRKLLSGEEFEQPYKQWFITKDGRALIFQVSTSPIIIDGEVKGFQHIGRDVTEEKHAEEMLSKIIDGSPVATFVIDKNHKVTHWNIAMELLTGISRDQMIGTDNHWRALYRTKRVTMADLTVDGISAGEIEKKYNGKFRQSRLMDGSYEVESFFSTTGEHGKWLLFNACPVKNENGEVIAAIETLQDITEQKKLQENIRFYGQLILRAQEDERKRIARELHDDVSSSMLLLIQRLDAIESGSSPRVSRSFGQSLEELRSQAVAVLERLRHCAQELRPRILDDLGLVAAIEWIADDMVKNQGIDTDVKVTGEEQALPLETQTLIFRIIQEALSNIRRHAKASEAIVNLEFKNDLITIIVSDNGKGFSLPERIEDLASTGSLGIMGMSERTQLMHGTLEIKSNPGKGTQVVVKIPNKFAAANQPSTDYSMLIKPRRTSL